MEILDDYTLCPEPLKGSVLAIGNFDGMHQGHRAVIAMASEAAHGAGAPAGVMTFEPHPRSFFQPDVPLFRLTPEALKVRLLAALGLDLAVILAFDAALASLAAEDFVSRILVDGLGISHVITGGDFHFGKGRKGTPEIMAALGKKHGFAVTQVEPQGSRAGDIYSSTRVRECLRAGNVSAAADILGYWWRVTGEVVGGDKRGHGLGFPTANMKLPSGFALKHGIYAVRVSTVNGLHHGAAYLGTRPSFDGDDAVLETFLLDFDGDLYGQKIELEFIEFLRGDQAFDSEEALKAQMGEDCEKVRQRLAQLVLDDPRQDFTL